MCMQMKRMTANTYDAREFGKTGTIQGYNVSFCLNCDDRIKIKEAVFDHGLSLLDEAGFLKHNI